MTISYIPKVRCGKCDHIVKDVQRMSDATGRWIRVRCHGGVERVEFATDPDEMVELWPTKNTPSLKPDAGSPR